MKILRNNRNILFILLFVLIAARFLAPYLPSEKGTQHTAPQENISRMFSEQKSNVQVTGRGTVIKVLPDDVRGSQHQKMIVRINSSQTILIAHNIDLAPRIPDLKQGDRIQFSGEYEWNEKGGVVHWTHRDPRKHHADGWLRHEGKIYQ